MKENVLQQKSYVFALRMIQVGNQLIKNKEYIISKQIIKSGTYIGANVEEAIGGHTEKEFHYKLNIAYKEARETKYWLRLLRDSDQIDSAVAQACIEDIEELLRILGSILITMHNKKHKR